MIINQSPISSLEEIVNHAEQEIGENFKINYLMSYNISMADLKSKPLEDVTTEAELWAAPEKPAELQINHGEFIKDGLDHIISELNYKKDSNRALFSLISQKHISDTGDTPIPSFMVLQCTIDNNRLYCTAYFRALEVSKFLRVNLEEIRLKICKIHEELLSFGDVAITIFAFRAYVNKNINTLRIPKIDRINPIELFVTLQENPQEVARMLREKCQASTFILTDSISHLIVAIQNWKSEKHQKILINNNAEEAMEIAKKLLHLRERSSHDPGIEALNRELHEKINAIAKELDK